MLLTEEQRRASLLDFDGYQSVKQQSFVNTTMKRGNKMWQENLFQYQQATAVRVMPYFC